MSSIALRLALLAATALTLVAVAGAAPTSYLDPSGDNGVAADIGAVTVELASDGYIHIVPTIANFPGLAADGAVLVGLDTDRSGSTGSNGGADYLMFMDLKDLSGTLFKWSGSDYDEAAGDARFVVGSSGIEFHVKPASLGGATTFNFFVIAATGADDALQLDIAPDNGSWFYEFKQPAVLQSVGVTFAPAAPRAGKVFRVSGVRARLDDGTAAAPTSYACRAKLGGKALRGTGAGGCLFAVPKTAKGKRLVVTVSATYAGRTISTPPRTFVVR
jgi:hypothetical protein